MKIQLKNIEEEIIYSDFMQECEDCIKKCKELSIKQICSIDNKIRRLGIKDNTNGSVFCCSKSIDDIKSSNTFKKSQNAILLGIEEIEKKKLLLKLETNRLIHNLTKTNAHNIQELYAVVPQEILTQNLNKQLKTISSIISKKPNEAARMFLRVAKNNAAIKTEFSVFNKVFGGKSSINKRKHKIRKVTLNLYHNFFLEFKDKNITVYFDDNEDYIFVDYESIHVILYHLIDNAAKYTLNNSILRIKFQSNPIYYSIILDMISIKIHDHELNKIFAEGYSGILAKKLNKEGNGLGLGHVSKILKLNNGELIVKNNFKPNMSKKNNGIWYDNNIFEIQLKNYEQQDI